MAPSGVTLNKPVAITLLILVGGGIILYKYYWNAAPGSPTLVEAGKGGVSAKDIDVSKLSDEQVKGVKVETGDLSVSVKGQEFKVYFQKTLPKETAKLTVLLLHGMAFNSDTWKEILTLQYLAAWGYQAIAIDLPGGSTSRMKDIKLGDVSKEEFLAAVITAIEKDLKPVIVSPSMSGSFALPYLFKDPSQATQRAVGYIPIAPVDAEKYKDKYPQSELRTLIVYGARDSTMNPHPRDSLKLLPRSQILEIPDAGHACYIEQPLLFHKALYDFLSKLNAF